MSEFFEIDNWDETEQIEYFENPINSYLNEDEKTILNAIHPEIKKKENKIYYKNDQEMITLANQIQRRLHVSTPDGEPSKFEINKKPPIPEIIKNQIDDKFLRFYGSLIYDNYYSSDLRDNYNSFFNEKLTNVGLGKLREILLLFSKKRSYLNSKKRITIYTIKYSNK